MQEAQNTKLVQDAYAAFLSQDITTLLGLMDDQIVWKPVVGGASHVPMAGERRGTAQVAEFFKIVSESLQFSRFEPREYVAQGNKVVALGHYTAKAPTTGKTIDSDFVMIFTIRNGKFVEFQEFADAAQLNAAFAGAPLAV